MSEHWSAKVIDILTSKTGDLRELANIAGEDPDLLYRGQSLEKCDLRGQDLRGMDLTNCNIAIENIDERTLIDGEFDPREVDLDRYVTFYIPRALAEIVKVYAAENNYVYLAWAYRNLIDRFSNLERFGQLDEVISEIKNNKSFIDIVQDINGKRAQKREILIENWKIANLYRVERRYPQFNIFALSLFSALLSDRIRKPKKRDLSALTLDALWPVKGEATAQGLLL